MRKFLQLLRWFSIFPGTYLIGGLVTTAYGIQTYTSLYDNYAPFFWGMSAWIALGAWIAPKHLRGAKILVGIAVFALSMHLIDVYNRITIDHNPLAREMPGLLQVAAAFLGIAAGYCAVSLWYRSKPARVTAIGRLLWAKETL